MLSAFILLLIFKLLYAVVDIPLSFFEVFDFFFSLGLISACLEPGTPKVLDCVADGKAVVPCNLNTLDTAWVRRVVRRMVYIVGHFLLSTLVTIKLVGE